MVLTLLLGGHAKDNIKLKSLLVYQLGVRAMPPSRTYSFRNPIKRHGTQLMFLKTGSITVFVLL